MAQAFGSEVQLVEVTTDDPVRGVAEKHFWVVAADPQQAIALVLAAVPEGWTVTLSEGQLTPKEIAGLKMLPGDVRNLTK